VRRYGSGQIGYRAMYCNGVGMPKGLARVRPRVDKGEGRRGWHSEYGSL
jgi:hypothetical protein